MALIKITIRSKDDSIHLLVSGKLKDATDAVLAPVRLQPGQKFERELEPGIYYFRFEIKRNSGEFVVEVEVDRKHGAEWTSLTVDPESFTIETLTGRVAAFKVP